MRALPAAWVSRLNGVAGSLCGVLTSDPVFALTFDDGPSQVNTPEILKVLADRGMRATFFVVVGEARKMPELVRDAVAAGHEVALHCYEHVDLRRSSPRGLIMQISRARGYLEQLTGREVRFFRPPYGTQSILSYAVARATGLEVVAWSASPRDFLALELERQVALAIRELRPGGILLAHDGGPSVPVRRRQFVSRLLDEVDREGWRPVTVSELVASGEPIRRLWFRGRAQNLIEEMAPFQVSAERAFTASIEPARPE